jgi:PAT family acetyl-CoA transporter-like MFS transporter 1
MYVAVMAFFARVSDPKVGGTYMTLLNTLTNLGGNWPATTMLWLVDGLTYKSCRSPSNGEDIPEVSCYDSNANEVSQSLST